MAEISRPELCIVGAGALGIALAQHARRLGASVTLVDRGAPEPCDEPQRFMRVAALMASATRAAAMRSASSLGLSAGDPKISIKAIEERASQVAADWAPVNHPDRLAAMGITVVSGTAQFADPATLVVGSSPIRAQAFVLAVGSDPAIPAIPGLEEAGYFTSDGLLENARKLTHLLVIGADAEGLALAQAYRRLGSQVTVVPQGFALKGFDVETASILMQALADEGVRVIDGGSVRSVQPRSQGIGAVVDRADGGEEALDLSHILVCDGRLASLDGIGLEAARLRPVRGQQYYASSPLGQTSNRRLRVVGTAAGLDQWPAQLAHGRSVIEALILGTPRQRPKAQPRLVPTEPALAQIGQMPGEGGRPAAGHGIFRSNLAENALVRAGGQGGGLVKVLVDARGRVIGASLVGPAIAEMAGVMALAMHRGVTLDELAELPLPQPSLISSLTGLVENRPAARTVSTMTRRLGALRRLMRL